MKYVYRIICWMSSPQQIGRRHSANKVFACTSWKQAMKIVDHNHQVAFDSGGGPATQALVVIKPKRFGSVEGKKIGVNSFDAGEVFIEKGVEVARFSACGELFHEHSLYDFALWLDKNINDSSLLEEYRQVGGGWIRKAREERDLEA